MKRNRSSGGGEGIPASASLAFSRWIPLEPNAFLESSQPKSISYMVWPDNGPISKSKDDDGKRIHRLVDTVIFWKFDADFDGDGQTVVGFWKLVWI
jgi:hypothetical protein